MYRIALIASHGLEDYILDVFSRHSEFRGHVVCTIRWAEKLPLLRTRAQRALRAVSLRLYSALKFLQLASPLSDSILLAGEDTETLMSMLYRVVFMKKNVRNIFLLKPFCARSRIDFISQDGFDPKFMIRVEDSEKSFSIAENMLQQVIPSASENALRTHDGIGASELADVFVKISDSCLLGCTYTYDGIILDGCINAGRPHLYSLCTSIASRTEPDAVYDEEVCPLTRVYSSWSCYHFMYEVLDKIIIAEELGFEGKYMLFRNPYAKILLDLLGLDARRIIWINSSDAGKLFLLRKAFDVEGFTLSSRRGLVRLNEFADSAALKLTEPGYPDRIFVAERLKDAPPDFTAISPTEHSPEEIVKLFCNARTVMSDDDPAMANILFMRRGSEVIDMFPRNWGDLLSDVISSRRLQYRTV